MIGHAWWKEAPQTEYLGKTILCILFDTPIYAITLCIL